MKDLIRKAFHIPAHPETYLDIIKLLAIYLVLFNHTGQNGFHHYTVQLAQPFHWMLLSFSTFDKIAVPLFFMASGALLLKKDESYKVIFQKRVLRFVCILAAVSFLFYWEKYRGTKHFTIQEFLKALYCNEISTHFWYLYSYICYLIMLPFLRKIAHSMNFHDCIVLYIVYTAALMIEVLDYAIFKGDGHHTYYLQFFVSNAYVAFPLLGYYIGNKMDRYETLDILIPLAITSVLSIFFSCIMVDCRCINNGEWVKDASDNCISYLAAAPAIFVFVGIRLLCIRYKPNQITSKIFFVLGSCTFGVYLFDPYFRRYTSCVQVAIRKYTGIYFATHIQILCACLLGLATTFAYKILASQLKETTSKTLNNILKTRKKCKD